MGQIFTNYSLGKAIKRMPFYHPEPHIEEFAPRYDRRHNFLVAADWNPVKKLTFSFQFSLSSGLPFNFMSESYNRMSTEYFHLIRDYPTHDGNQDVYILTPIYENFNASRFPPYHRADISLKYSMKWRQISFKPFIQIINLYNQKNVLFYYSDGSYCSSIPLLPLIGFEIMY